MGTRKRLLCWKQVQAVQRRTWVRFWWPTSCQATSSEICEEILNEDRRITFRYLALKAHSAANEVVSDWLKRLRIYNRCFHTSTSREHCTKTTEKVIKNMSWFLRGNRLRYFKIVQMVVFLWRILRGGEACVVYSNNISIDKPSTKYCTWTCQSRLGFLSPTRQVMRQGL